MKCPVCGNELRPNKGWAAQFYDGYCNTCDMPVVDGVEDVIELTPEQASEVIDTRKPPGLFWLKEGDKYVGIDNRTEDAWTEEFDTKEECLNWLRGYEDDEEL